MTLYDFEAEDDAGNFTAGQLAATNAKDAIETLEARGLVVLALKLSTNVGSKGSGIEASSSFKSKLLGAMKNSAELIPALEALGAELPSKRDRLEVQSLISELKKGTTASDLLANPSLAPWVPTLVRGSLGQSANDRILESLSAANDESARRRHRRQSLIYPFVVSALTCCLLVFLSSTVVPIFRRMFFEFGLRLPLGTRLVINVSDTLVNYPLTTLLWCVLGLIGIYVTVLLWVSSAMTTRLFGSFVAGNSYSVWAMARFSSSLADMVSIGAPTSEALKVAGRASRHAYFRQMALALAAEIEEGRTPISRCYAAQCFPRNILYALDSNCSPAQSVAILRRLSTNYQQRAILREHFGNGVAGTIAVLFVGMSVGFVIIALFMPLVQMITSLT